MTSSAEFTDPRLVAAYDSLNVYEPGTQPDFYLELAEELSARTVIEVGSGTGLVSTHLARAGVDVIGLEPSERMLARARHRPGGERVRWVLGDVSALASRSADMAFMAGHVAQFFLADADWHDALTAIHGALRPGGTFAFESRNPQVEAWKSWTSSRTRRTVLDPVLGPIETWVAEAKRRLGSPAVVRPRRGDHPRRPTPAGSVSTGLRFSRRAKAIPATRRLSIQPEAAASPNP